MLGRISDQELINGLKDRVRAERAALVELLRYLEEVEIRELHLARGFPSLFAFCVDDLGYSEGEAHVRIQAMRLTRAVPEVRAKISTGELTLTVAAKAQNCFRRAAKMDQRVARERKLEVINSLLNIPSRDAERKLVSVFPEAGLPKEFMKPISEEMTRIEFNVNRAQLAKFEKLKGLLAHKNFEGKWDKLFENLADIALAKFAKRNGEFIPEKEPADGGDSSLPSNSVAKSDAPLLEAPQVKPRQSRSRYIPDGVRKFVWQRDQGRCKYVDPVTGKRCLSTHAVQFDHIVPFSMGGETVSTNLQLLCSFHNKWRTDL